MPALSTTRSSEGRAQSALELSPASGLARGGGSLHLCSPASNLPTSNQPKTIFASNARAQGKSRGGRLESWAAGIYGRLPTMAFSPWPSKLRQGRMVEAELGRRAASERPMQTTTGIFNPVLPSVVGQMPVRAVSTGPPVIHNQLRQNISEQWQPTSFRDNGIYECNYESIGGGSSETKQSNQAIMKLEQAVRSIDQVLAKDISKLKHKQQQQRKDNNGAVQYDSITVLPTVALAELPPPPLPRTRSFRDGGVRARTAHPWGREGSLGGGGGRASSAPPVSPVVPRRTR